MITMASPSTTVSSTLATGNTELVAGLRLFDATTIVIGQSAPLTGANAELGNDIRNGALAYFSKVNAAGGVHGRKIELATLDDGNAVPRA